MESYEKIDQRLLILIQNQEHHLPVEGVVVVSPARDYQDNKGHKRFLEDVMNVAQPSTILIKDQELYFERGELTQTEIFNLSELYRVGRIDLYGGMNGSSCLADMKRTVGMKNLGLFSTIGNRHVDSG